MKAPRAETAALTDSALIQLTEKPKVEKPEAQTGLLDLNAVLQDPPSADIIGLVVLASLMFWPRLIIVGYLLFELSVVGAFAFIVINNYVRDVELPLIGGSFNTIIGLIFLVIVIVSPDGLMGIWDRLWRSLGRRGGGTPESAGRAGRARRHRRPRTGSARHPESESARD